MFIETRSFFHRFEVEELGKYFADLQQRTPSRTPDPEELGFYLDFFRYGVPPHGGFGMGLQRVIMLLLHQPSIREVTYLFRGPNRLLP